MRYTDGTTQMESHRQEVDETLREMVKTRRRSTESRTITGSLILTQSHNQCPSNHNL